MSSPRKHKKQKNKKNQVESLQGNRSTRYRITLAERERTDQRSENGKSYISVAMVGDEAGFQLGKYNYVNKRINECESKLTYAIETATE